MGAIQSCMSAQGSTRDAPTYDGSLHQSSVNLKTQQSSRDICILSRVCSFGDQRHAVQGPTSLKASSSQACCVPRATQSATLYVKNTREKGALSDRAENKNVPLIGGNTESGEAIDSNQTMRRCGESRPDATAKRGSASINVLGNMSRNDEKNVSRVSKTVFGEKILQKKTKKSQDRAREQGDPLASHLSNFSLMHSDLRKLDSNCIVIRGASNCNANLVLGKDNAALGGIGKLAFSAEAIINSRAPCGKSHSINFDP